MTVLDNIVHLDSYHRETGYQREWKREKARLTLFGSIWAAKFNSTLSLHTQPSRSPTSFVQHARRVHVLLTVQYLFHDISSYSIDIMARLSGIAQPAGMGKTATGVGGKGLGKSTAKRHRYE
jgi:hypothetical protein